MLLRAFPSLDGGIAQCVGCLLPLFEEFPLLDHPAVAINPDVPRGDLAFRVLLGPLHRDRISARALQNDLVSDFRLSQGLCYCAFNVLPPDLSRTLQSLKSHKIR